MNVEQPKAPAAVALSPERWASNLRFITSEILDVLVVGGGIVGAGCALEAAAAGLSVGLVEADDFGSGTSSASSKLVHGGLRYLRSGEFSLVREALQERGALLRLAPHLVRPLEFLYPLHHHWERLYVGAGLALYDTLSRLPGSPPPLPRARHLGARDVRRRAPALNGKLLTGAVRYYDAQVDDARLVIDVVRTAASLGAKVVSRARVTALSSGSDGVHEACVDLTDSGDQAIVRARAVVAATGIWSDAFARAAEVPPLPLRPSKGVHLVLPRRSIAQVEALISRTRDSVLFVLPWGAHWIVGTTDTPWPYEQRQAFATKSDIDYLLGELNAILARPVGRDEIEATFVGLRPLAGGRGPTSQLSREHVVDVPRRGLAVVAGGKLTTFRVTAHDALAAALASAELAPVSLRDVALVGAAGFGAAMAATAVTSRVTGLTEDQVRRLLGRYGSLVKEVVETTATSNPLRPLSGFPECLRGEIAYGVTHEGARHLDDVLSRRTRASIETPDRGELAMVEAAEIIAPLLGWGRRESEHERERYLRRRTALIAAEAIDDDVTALGAEVASIPGE